MTQCQALLDAGATQLSQDKVGEYYTSGVIAAMIEEGSTFHAIQIDPSRMHVLGTPSQLLEWCIKQPSPPAQRICFDLDHTLVTAAMVAGDYSTCKPLEENVACLRALHAQGHTIIIFTDRRMHTHNGNVGAVVADIGATTIASLQALNIPYHELCFGKPHADFYVDDLAVSAFSDIHKEVGIYSSAVNAVQRNDLAVAQGRLRQPTITTTSTPWRLLAMTTLAGAACGAAVTARAMR